MYDYFSAFLTEGHVKVTPESSLFLQMQFRNPIFVDYGIWIEAHSE